MATSSPLLVSVSLKCCHRFCSLTDSRAPFVPGSGPSENVQRVSTRGAGGDARIPAASGCPALHSYAAEHEGLRVRPAPPQAACTASAEGGASQCGAVVRTPLQERPCEQLRSALK